MPMYRVPITRRDTEIVEVVASNKEEAMNKALDGEGKFVELIDGDSEVYYPDIQEVKE